MLFDPSYEFVNAAVHSLASPPAAKFARNLTTAGAAGKSHAHSSGGTRPKLWCAFWPGRRQPRYPAVMLNRILAGIVLGLGWPAIALADTVAQTVVPSEPEAREEVDVDEVLRSARKELLALLARDAASESPAPEPEAGPVVVGLPPPSMTSALPAPGLSSTGPTPQLSWLRELVLPDIPIRWDDRLVRLLDYYRNDARGRAQMRGLLARQGAYGPMIRAKLRAASLPEDLVYVAMVESAYDPKARSDVGAVGMWQLMTAPATEYELEMSRWVDARMNPEQCTDAALRYLRDVNAELGSWSLSMAAFNMGYGALLRAMQKYNTNDFWLLASLEAGLPYETIMYVTKVMAFAIIGHNRERFGLSDVVPEPRVDTVTVEIAGGISLARVARAAGLETSALADLNPELKKPRLPPDVKTWPLRIPRERLQRFREKWASQGQVLPPHREHVLRLGERLSDVADLYSTTTAKLLKLNDLPDGAALRAGSRLIVPDIDPTPKLDSERPVVGLPGDAFVYVDRKRVFYRVADRDELGEIARFFHVTPEEVRMWNRISMDAKLQRGMFLQLFVPADAELSQTLVLAPNQVRTLVVGSEEFFNFHETQQNRVRLRYRVKPGDTLRSLSDRFDLSIGSIARINQFSRSKKLEPDSEIIVYVSDETAKRSASN
jgi:membrane-bound lytic murein transglycosylase D